MTLRQFIGYAKKAIAVGTTLEGAAVALGFLTTAQEGAVTAALGAVSAALVYVVGNLPKPKKAADMHTDTPTAPEAPAAATPAAGPS